MTHWFQVCNNLNQQIFKKVLISNWDLNEITASVPSLLDTSKVFSLSDSISSNFDSFEQKVKVTNTTLRNIHWRLSEEQFSAKKTEKSDFGSERASNMILCHQRVRILSFSQEQPAGFHTNLLATCLALKYNRQNFFMIRRKRSQSLLDVIFKSICDSQAMFSEWIWHT